MTACCSQSRTKKAGDGIPQKYKSGRFPWPGAHGLHAVPDSKGHLEAGSTPREKPGWQRQEGTRENTGRAGKGTQEAAATRLNLGGGTRAGSHLRPLCGQHGQEQLRGHLSGREAATCCWTFAYPAGSFVMECLSDTMGKPPPKLQVHKGPGH